MRNLRTWMVPCLAAAVAAAGCAAPVMRTGSIAGRLALPAVRGVDIRDAVVWAEPAAIAGPVAKGMARPKPAPIATVMRRDTVSMAALPGRFEPRVLAVAPGTVVRFENRDKLWHQVIGRSAARTFDAGSCAPGRSRCITFERPGAVTVFCQLDRTLSGWVFVAADASFTHPDRTGAYELHGLPRGAYTLHVWHPTAGTRERRVVLDGTDAAVSLDY